MATPVTIAALQSSLMDFLVIAMHLLARTGLIVCAPGSR
jgi:hypothetical protein